MTESKSKTKHFINNSCWIFYFLQLSKQIPQRVVKSMSTALSLLPNFHHNQLSFHQSTQPINSCAFPIFLHFSISSVGQVSPKIWFLMHFIFWSLRNKKKPHQRWIDTRCFFFCTGMKEANEIILRVRWHIKLIFLNK